MAFISKTWEDIQCQYPNRYRAVKTDLSEEQVTMLNDFGTISVSGDVFDAATMNNLEDRIDSAFDEVIETLSGTSDPSPSLGKNGDLYFKFEVQGNDMTIKGLFVKILNQWLSVPLNIPPEPEPQS